MKATIIVMTGDTFDIRIPEYISSIETKNYSRNTITAYRRTIELFARYKTYLTEHDGKVPESIGELSSAGLTAEVKTSLIELEKFFELICKKQNLEPASIQQYESALAAFYRYLLLQDAVVTNPMEKVERPKIKDRRLKYLHHDEVIDFISSIPNPRDALIIRTIYVTGMRVSEICGLRVEDIDFDDETITVHGKGGKVRTVFCETNTLSMIRDYINDRTTGAVFLSRRGGALSVDVIQLICKRYAPAGITPHKIRHSYASELYKNSHDLQLVQETLGHASIQTTQIYVHTNVEERRKAYRQYFPTAQFPETQE